MRKSPWMIPVVLLCALLGSPTARADTIVTNAGGYVTGIDGMTIEGITYNVTFGFTEDTTFDVDYDGALDAINEINADLGYTPISETDLEYAVESIGLAIGSYLPYTTPPTPWTAYSNTLAATYNTEIADHPGQFYWAEFSPVTTPEPDTALLTLSGLGMLGGLVVIRKRVARRHPQVT